MLTLTEKAIEEVNALPRIADLQSEWRVWQDECAMLDRQCLQQCLDKKICVLEITIRAARKQIAEYHAKAREYADLAWSEDSPYYKSREMNLANFVFETLEARLQDEVDAMEKELTALKRKLKKLGKK